jgi:hypothetical protein
LGEGGSTPMTFMMRVSNRMFVPIYGFRDRNRHRPDDPELVEKAKAILDAGLEQRFSEDSLKVSEPEPLAIAS